MKLSRGLLIVDNVVIQSVWEGGLLYESVTYGLGVKESHQNGVMMYSNSPLDQMILLFDLLAL